MPGYPLYKTVKHRKGELPPQGCLLSNHLRRWVWRGRDQSNLLRRLGQTRFPENTGGKYKLLGKKEETEATAGSGRHCSFQLLDA